MAKSQCRLSNMSVGTTSHFRVATRVLDAHVEGLVALVASKDSQ